MNSISSAPPSVPPSFRGELYFLMAKLLENSPCTETAARLKTELTEKGLLQPRYDWRGIAHSKTFRDMEEEFDPSGVSIPKEHLLRLCFDLCNVNPAVPSVRSLLSHARLEAKRRQGGVPLVPNVMQQIQNKHLGIGHYPNLNIWTRKGDWHEKHLCRQLKRLRKTLGHLSSVYCLTFDRTGSLAFTGADDMLVKCWNVSDGRLLYTFRGGAAEVSDMTVSHDNRMLAVATLDKIARVWNLHTGEPLAVLTRHTGTLTGINFSSYIGVERQRYLACTSSDGTAAFWRYRYANSTSTASKAILNTKKTDIKSTTFKVEFDELPTRWCERSRPGKAKIISSCFSPGGLFFCTGSADHYVRVYQMDCPDGPQRILEECEHEDQVDSIQWCNTSQIRLLSGSSDGTARIWTYQGGRWNTTVLNMSQNDNRSSETPKNVVSSQNQDVGQSYAQQPPTSLATANHPQGRLGNARRGVQQENLEQRRPARRAAAQAAAIVNAAHAANDQQANSSAQSRTSRDTTAQPGNTPSDQNQVSSTNHDEKKAVTMVQWSTDDRFAITAVANFQLKVWNSKNGLLVTTLRGHSSLVYTVEPHPLTENIFLSAGHDGYLKVWDISTSSCLFSSRNIIAMQGHAAVYDAKWSPGDGNVICATDSHGHLLFYGIGSSERYEKYPVELFFHTDYRPLLRDSYHNVVDEQTQTLPHLMPPPLLIDSEGSPYPPQIQKYVRGRENSTNADALQPMLAPARNNVDLIDLEQFEQQQQPRRLQPPPPPAMQPDPDAASANDNIVQIPRSMMIVASRQQHLINADNLVSQDSNGSSGTGHEDSGPEHRLDRHVDEQPGPSNSIPSGEVAPLAATSSTSNVQDSSDSNTNTSRQEKTIAPYKLCILKDHVREREVVEILRDIDAKAWLESSEYNRESGIVDRKRTEHDYAKHKTKAKAYSSTNTANRRREERNRLNHDRTQNTSSRQTSNGQPRRRYLMRDDDEEEENANAEDNDEDELNTSDCSLDESDFSASESTTEASTEHSDWGSGDTNEPDTSQHQVLVKKRSPKNKRKRNAAEKCRERMLKPGDQITEEFIPSPWLAESIPRKSPFFPQIGDVLMYFKQGHERYVDLVKERKAYKINMKEQHWMTRKNLKEVCMVRITGIKWEIRPPRLCVLKLSILNESNGRPTGDHFTIKYHDMNDVVDFLVLRQTFNSYKGKHWKKGDRIRCQIDDCWWKGTVQKIVHHDAAKKSPFLSIYVNWDNGEKEYLSPWDLEALDVDTSEIADGTYATQDELKSCLYKPSSEEWNCMGRESECTRISEALESIMSLAIAEPFNYPVDLTNYPEYMLDVEYPMDLSLIKARVDNLFYRRVAAIQRDLKYIYENAASFNRPKSDIVRNAKIVTKLADEIAGNTNKSKTDVSNEYHRLSQNFQWSSISSSDEEENNETQRPSSRASRASRTSRSSQKSPNLNPKKWKHDCNVLLNEMVSLPISQPFREPVSEIEFPDYHRHIATPMDLSTVRESLHIGDYSSPLEFEKDVHLIFKNSKEYNTVSGSKVLKMTHKMEEWFDGKLPELVSDWRKTNRRLTAAKHKHKAKMRHSSGASSTGTAEVKGKGKGKGKGQSNRVNRSQRQESEDEHDESDDIETEDEESEEITPEKSKRTRMPLTKRNQRKCTVDDSSDGEDEHEDYKRVSTRPTTSRRSSTLSTPQKKNSEMQELIESKPLDCPLDLEVEEEPNTPEEISPTYSNSSLQRRASSRVPKQPIRFRDESSEVEDSPSKRSLDRATKYKTSLKEEYESDEDTKPSASISQNIVSSTNVIESTSKSVTESLRSVRIRRHKKRDESYVYSDDNLDKKDENMHSGGKKSSGMPTGTKRKASEIASDSEDEPLVKRTATQITNNKNSKASQSGDEEDIPLARKKSNQRTVNGHLPQNSECEDINQGAQEMEHPTTSRPIRSAAKAAIKNLTGARSESEDERPLRRTASSNTNSPRKNVAFAPQVKSSAPQFDHDSSEDPTIEEYSGSRKKKSTRARNNRSAKSQERADGRKRRSEESESEFSESNSENQTSENEEENSEQQTSDEDFVCNSSPTQRLGMRNNLRKKRTVKPQRRAEATAKKAREALDSAESDNEGYGGRSKRKSSGGRQQTTPRKRLANRNSTREDNQSSDDIDNWGSGNRELNKSISGRQKRSRAARRNYNEAESDNSSSGRENRRPNKRSTLRKSTRTLNENSDLNSDGEDEQMQSRRQTTVTSRGRISKPNPRII